MTNARVMFYMPELEDPAQLDQVDPDRDWHLLGAGRYQTVGQTYIRLRRAGHDVGVATAAPRRGIVVVFAPNLRRFLAECADRRAVTLVCVEADRPVRELPRADVVVRHNGYRVDGRRVFFVPNWVQGGLIPRDETRGSRVSNVAYKGRAENLHPEFRSERWKRLLAERGVDFSVDGEGELRHDHTYSPGAMGWHDYTDADILLAVRPGATDAHRRKPAVKLVNAWAAGVPALLGPEYAYREQRRSELDYVEVASVDAAIAAVERLASDPDLYQAMVDNGRRRASDFSVAAITAMWEELLLDRLVHWRRSTASLAARRLLTPAYRAVGRAQRRLDDRKFAVEAGASQVRTHGAEAAR